MRTIDVRIDYDSEMNFKIIFSDDECILFNKESRTFKISNGDFTFHIYIKDAENLKNAIDKMLEIINDKCTFDDCGFCYRPETKYVNGCIGITNCTYKKVEKLEDYFEELYWKFDSERTKYKKYATDERTFFKSICRHLIHKLDEVK